MGQGGRDFSFQSYFLPYAVSHFFRADYNSLIVSSELKGSTGGQKIGPEDTIQGLPATPVSQTRRARFCCYLHDLVTPTLKNTS